MYEIEPCPGRTNIGHTAGRLPDNKDDFSRMMHFLPCGNRANETARSSRAIGVCCALTVFVLPRHWRPGECEGDRQAKVGENVTGGLQHMGALRPDLPIEAMIKMKMGSAKTEVMGPSTGNVCCTTHK